MRRGKSLDLNTWGMTTRKRGRLKTATNGSRRQRERATWKKEQA